MAKEDPKKLEALRSAASVDARGSPLYRWMWNNYEEFADIVNARRPNWQGVTDFFISQGFVSADGKELRPNSVVQTWERVKRRRESRKVRKKSKSILCVGTGNDVVSEAVAGVNEPIPCVGIDNVSSRSRITPVTPASPVSPTVPVRSVAPALERDERSDPDAVMRALDEQLNAGRPKMPKPIK